MPQIVSGQDSDEHPESATESKPAFENSVEYSDGDFALAWEVDGDLVRFRLIGRTNGWVSVGFNPVDRKEGADMVFGWVDDSGEGYCVDTYAVGPTGEHPSDEELGGSNDILSWDISEVDDITDFLFTRYLNTGDEYDSVLTLDTETRIIWALGMSDNPESFHTARGSASIILGGMQEAALDSNEFEELSGSPSLFWTVHYVLMILSFLLVILSIFIARLRKRIRNWLRLHTVFAGIGFLLLFIGVGAAFVMSVMYGWGHMITTHSWIGLVIGVIMLMNVLSGSVIVKKNLNARTHRLWHIRIGWSTVIILVVFTLIEMKRSGLI